MSDSNRPRRAMSSPEHPGFSASEEDSAIFYAERGKLKLVKQATLEKAQEVLVTAKARKSEPPPSA